MKPMLTAFAASIAIAIGASVVLPKMGFSSQEKFAGADTRVDAQ